MLKQPGRQAELVDELHTEQGRSEEVVFSMFIAWICTLLANLNNIDSKS
jgi:hypothetical protein